MDNLFETGQNTVDKIPQMFIIDGYGQIYRSYFAFLTNPLKDKDGNNVSAVFGFFNTLMSLVRQYGPEYVFVAMDSRGKTFRHEMYPQYKANRDKTPDDLHSQIPVITSILDSMGIRHYAEQGMEADDIIATMCRACIKLKVKPVIVTGDKDLLQLVDSDVSALRPPRKGEYEYRLCHESDVQEIFGIRPSQMVDYLTILGDASDNVPGIDGIGEKGACKLLQAFGTLDEVYANIDRHSKGIRTKLENARDHIELSRTLVTLKDDLFDSASVELESHRTSAINWEEARKAFLALGSDKLASSAAKFLSSGSAGSTRQTKVSGSSNDLFSQDTGAEESGPENPGSEKNAEAVLEARPGRYTAILGYEEAQRILSSIPDGSVVAFDTETTDVNEMKAELVGFSFSWEDEVSYYVPLVCPEGVYLSEDEARKLLSGHLVRFRLVGQNIKYDFKVLRRLGVDIGQPYFDTMLAAWMLESSSVSLSLDSLSEKYLDCLTVHYDEVVPKGSVFSDVPLEKAVRYGAEDSDLTLRLYKVLLPLLEQRGLLEAFMQIEMPLVRVLGKMELEGIMLSTQRLSEYEADLSKEVLSVQDEIYRVCGKTFNLNSPKQLQEVLFVDRNLPTGKKTRSGFSTDSDVLESLAGSVEDPVPGLILKYRMLSKLLNTYVLALPQLIDSSDGRLHTSFLQTGTATGRLSSKNPNLQNIPIRTEEGRRIRDAFVPREGFELLSADYSQIELVVLSHLSQDRALMQSFLDGEDVHRQTASMIFGVFPDMVTPSQRRIAKTINFGIMYGMSAFSLAGDLRIPRKDAQKFIDTYFEQYSRVRAFMDEIRSKAREDGFVRTAFGHVRYIPEMKSPNKAVLAGAERVAVNTVIQGTAAEIMKKAMISIDRKLEEEGLESRLLLQVHDEVILEVKKEEAEHVRLLVGQCMEQAVRLSVPLRSAIETASSWGQMH